MHWIDRSQLFSYPQSETTYKGELIEHNNSKTERVVALLRGEFEIFIFFFVRTCMTSP